MKSFRHLPLLFLFACLVGMRAIAAPAPEVSLSLRGVGDATVEQGEPLRIAVRIRAPRAAKEVITLAPSSGSWSEAVAVELAPVGGGAPVARAEALGKPDASTAKLDAGHIAGGLWRFKADAMQSIPPGKYVVRARLVIRGGGGWTGEAISHGTPLQIVAATEAADRVAQRAVNRAQDALLDGRTEEAATILDALLARTPDDPRVLTARAEVALRAGNPMAAMICLNRAAPKMTGGQPPIEREELLSRTMTAIHGKAAPAVNPPQWSWPPAAVMEPTPAQKAVLQQALQTKAAGKAAPVTPPAVPPVVPIATPTVVAPTKPVDVTSSPKASPGAPAIPAPIAKAGLPEAGVVVPAKELTDAKVSADASGQWAASARAGSQYSNPGYAALKATGAPDVPVTGDSPLAWCPAAQSGGNDWLEVSFAKPVNATEVRVRQSNCPGAIIKIEALESDGTSHVWWEGADAYKPSEVRETVWFAVRVPKTLYLVAKVKITLNLAAVPGWKQIDAVQLVGVAP